MPLGLSVLFAAAALGTESSRFELQGEVTWTSSSFTGGYEDRNGDWISLVSPWENGTTADLAATGAIYLNVSKDVEAAGLSVSGGKTAYIRGDELKILENGSISATGSNSGVVIENIVNFENGGTLTGTVTTAESGMIKVSGGTLTSANISGDGTLYIAEGARVEKTNIITSGYTQTVKLAGTGTFAVSTEDKASFVGTLHISGGSTEEFEGTFSVSGNKNSKGCVVLNNFSGIIEIGGGLSLRDTDFDSAKRIVWTESGRFEFSLQNTDKIIASDFEVLEGVNLEIYYGDSVISNTLTFAETVSGDGTINVNLWGPKGRKDVFFEKQVSLGGLHITNGEVSFCSQASFVRRFKGSAGTLWKDDSAYGDILNITSDATLTITGTANAETPHEGAFVLGTYHKQVVNVDGVLNLQNDGMSNIDGTGEVNVSGEMNFNAGLFVNDKNSDDNVVALNVKDGARINIGGVGMGLSPSLALNLEGNATVGSLAEEWSIDRALKLNGTLTLDTEKRNLNLEGAATGTGEASWVSVNGKISGDGALGKTGAGTLTLNSENTYTGGTRVDGGILNVARSKALGSGGLSVKDGAEAWLSIGTNDHGRFVFDAENPLAIDAGGKLLIKGKERPGYELISRVTVSRTTVENAGTLEINNLGILELSGGKLDVSGTLTNFGTLNIIAQTDGENSGVVLRDGSIFENKGTVMISAGTLAEGKSVTVFADAFGNGILDSTGTVKGSGEIKVFGGYYENGVFTAGEKLNGNAGADLGGGTDGVVVAVGQSIVITDKNYVDKTHHQYQSVTLSSDKEMKLVRVHNKNYEKLEVSPGEFVEFAAAWDFEFAEDGNGNACHEEVLVVMNVGEGLSLDTIKIYHKENGEKWDDYTDKVGNISYDSETGLLAFTTTEFSTYGIDTGNGSNSIAVPEPSAFGLLAGLGALALVASRRRRR